MGGVRSREETCEAGQEEIHGQATGSAHACGVCPTFHLNTAEAERPPEAVVELPQCQMGGKAVDDMRFMISCTNWY